MAKWISKLNEVLGGKRSESDEERESGLVPTSPLKPKERSAEESAEEREALREILLQYAPGEDEQIDKDLSSLVHLTSEVKAINNQAAMLHGERIKKAQAILKNYREGAFTAWLKKTYGNRQTPYNLLQYYDFVTGLPHELRNQAEQMPRQAIYTLASRSGDAEKKFEIVKGYQGETKNELLSQIREAFPLASTDKRRQDIALGSAQMLRKLDGLLKKGKSEMSSREKETLYSYLDAIRASIDHLPVKSEG